MKRKPRKDKFCGVPDAIIEQLREDCYLAHGGINMMEAQPVVTELLYRISGNDLLRYLAAEKEDLSPWRRFAPHCMPRVIVVREWLQRVTD